MFDVLNDAVLAVFGEDGRATIRRAGHPDLAVDAIYDSRHYAIEEGEAGASALITSVTLAQAHADLVVPGLTLILVRGAAYTALDKKPDGQGLVALPLEKAGA